MAGTVFPLSVSFLAKTQGCSILGFVRQGGRNRTSFRLLSGGRSRRGYGGCAFAAAAPSPPSTVAGTSGTDIPGQKRVEKVSLACPVCYQPLTQTGRQGLHPRVVDESSFRCQSCQKPYMSMGGIIDLTISGGAEEMEAAVPIGTSLFQNPIVAYIYDRGYRDAFGIFNFPGLDEEFKMAQALLKPARGSTIMDVSCGAGSFTRRFLASGDYESVIASDFSEAMLENCRGFLENDSSVDLTKVALVRADIARLPFKTMSLTAVHAGAAIHCWPQPTTSVAEISRVLKPGGVFVASTFLLPAPPSALSGVFAPIRRTISQLGLPFQWWTESEIRDITEACGLVGWQSIRRGSYILFTAHKPQ